VEGPEAALPLAQRFTELSRERGWVFGEFWGVGTLLDLSASSGRWDEALHAAAEAETLMEGHGDVCDLGQTRAFHAFVRIWRGESDLAMSLADWSLEKARGLEEPSHLTTALIASAAARMPDDPSVAQALLEELSLSNTIGFQGFYELAEMLRTARGIADPELAERLTEQIASGLPTQRCVRTYGEGLLAEACGEYEVAATAFADAAVRWHDFRAPYEEAHALLGQGRCLLALEKAEKGVPILEQARQIFDKLKARPALKETEALLGGVDNV
jgi:tetratricopeptide (TPR) repeat protein